MFFETLNNGLENFFEELSKSKRLKGKRRDYQFTELQHTGLLFSSDYLDTLLDDANKAEYETVLDYLYRFNNHEIGEDEHLNILEVDNYKRIEQRIIDRMW
jgi:hypothetical protein